MRVPLTWDWTVGMIFLLIAIVTGWAVTRDHKTTYVEPTFGGATGDALYSLPPQDIAALEAAAGTAIAEPPAAEAATAPPAVAPQPPTRPAPAVGATSYVVLERSCGTVLGGFAEHERLAPASLTKIITALVVVERVPLTDGVVSDVSASGMKGSSVMGLEPGDRLSVNDLLYGLMLRSGNDAALVLAKHTAGTVDAFVALMNAKAREIGLQDTQFTNPHGLDSPGLYSTSYDMAQAGRALLQNPVLARMSSTPEYQAAWDKPPMRNGNKLLKSFEGAYGVKNGYTENARQTLVAAAQRDGRDIVVSLFGSPDRYTDARALLDWAFTSTHPAC
jgi:D-alanyl-D-alanine carboxypeptidase